MKIVCVCAMGLGSSLILRMNVEKALERLGVKDAKVEVADTGSARGANPDVIVSSHSFCEELADMNVPMVEVVNYTDIAYIEAELKEILSK
ncbi:PTS sugar transporter subunit IIB [Mediterraneibacter sp. NSJ-55]|uniref:PTS sugar transporter subunit IIB n=1 Tax=Mediterraneibacter hominis TaxID=2763054 RepID=A0A923RPU5_9FIRM|nr:PTS sugar transporter subunit IIB [Mediterraneibacter hominis]MBC5688889.1 PTS sugar transporter subunit IIB [Mediterraneibacter hominis]